MWPAIDFVMFLLKKVADVSIFKLLDVVDVVDAISENQEKSISCQ